MKLTRIPTFHSENGDIITFLPIEQKSGKVIPGFTHTVIVNREKVGYLSQDHKPDAKVAGFFLRKSQGVAWSATQERQERSTDSVCVCDVSHMGTDDAT